MRIKNKTKWSTESLRYIVGCCLQERGATKAKPLTRSRKLIITVRTGRDGVRWPHASGVRDVIELSLKQPPVDLDVASDEHVERVTMLARRIDWAICILEGGTPNEETRHLEKPIVWLSDWYAVNRGEKGRAAGCPVSPLVPAKQPDKNAARVALLIHAETMLKKATTRCKRAETLRKKWQRKVSRLKALT